MKKKAIHNARTRHDIFGRERERGRKSVCVCVEREMGGVHTETEIERS